MTDTTSPDFKSVIVPPPADSLVLEVKKLDFFYGAHQSLFGVDQQHHLASFGQPSSLKLTNDRQPDTVVSRCGLSQPGDERVWLRRCRRAARATPR